MNEPRLLTTRQAAAFLGVHINTLKGLNIAFYRIGSRGDRRYDRDELDAYLLRVRVKRKESYVDRFGHERCADCGYGLPQHGENCERQWAPGELVEVYGK